MTFGLQRGRKCLIEHGSRSDNIQRVRETYSYALVCLEKDFVDTVFFPFKIEVFYNLVIFSWILTRDAMTPDILVFLWSKRKLNLYS